MIPRQHVMISTMSSGIAAMPPGILVMPPGTQH
jgi:hypothetical protein